MNVKDIANQSTVVFGIQHDWRDPISVVHVSPGSAETLVRRGGITNHVLLAYFLTNISAKNYQNWLMCVEVIMCVISVFFCDTMYSSSISSSSTLSHLSMNHVYMYSMQC